MEAVASRAGYQVLLAHGPDPTTVREALAALAAHPLEGIIFMSISARQDSRHLAEAGVQAALRLSRLARRPTAILAANDAMAMGALRGILLSGLRCPQDVAVVGIGDPPFMAREPRRPRR